MTKDSILGSLLGCMVGDSMGLLYEGLSPKRQRKLYKEINSQKFIFGNGLISDDTEHSIFIAHAICRSGGNEDLFSQSLASSLKKWLLSLPYGIGFATLRSCFRLLIGFPASKSGVFSAGNGPAMRSALLGICYGNDFRKLRKMVELSTRITHTDIKAEFGALAIALAAYMSSMEHITSPESYFEKLTELLLGTDCLSFLKTMECVIESVNKDESTFVFCDKIGLSKGISGYVCHTVPAVIHCWLRNQNDFKSGIYEIIECGGDTDTTAAILGSIIGAKVHRTGIPEDWSSKVILWPYSMKFIDNICNTVYESLACRKPIKVKQPAVLLVLLRNILCYPIIIYHVLRRLIPPY